MKLTERNIKWLKFNMIFFAILFVILLLTAYLTNNLAQERSDRLYLWGCILFYLSMRMGPILGLSIMFYCAAFGYQKGYIEQYYEHSTRGVLTGEEARKLGRNQIAVGVIAFGLCSYGAFMDVSVMGDCPQFFYDATWAQIFDKLL